ncbi:hypothetical protein DI392_11040 [Vibrio albus]|uniref:Uncharacterized protein n=1 Tax=Vibrio albus TaxID=2200953 RepID=A0A2U3B9C2_9VIBR|nr:hypothetical protein [Vibrio albus]PWI33382.1 hypothetical protein DI392_11040 [Vibrio albus]
MMIFKTFITGLCLLISTSAMAFPPQWLLPMLDTSQPLWTLDQAQESTELYDCGLEEEDREFCSGQVKYYDVDIEGRLWIIDGQVKEIDITTIDFSPYLYSELQLNLRKDAFNLYSATINGEEFNIPERLNKQTVDEVNRDFIRFTGKSALGTNRYFEWRPGSDFHTTTPERRVIFTSNGKQVTLRFYREPVISGK